MSKKKILSIIMTVAVILTACLGLTACGNTASPESYSYFYFVETESSEPILVNVYTKDFKDNASIYEVLERANYKYDFNAKFDKTLPTSPFLTNIKNFNPSSTEYVALYTTSKTNVDLNVSKIIDGKTFYYSSKGIADITLASGQSYLFDLTAWKSAETKWKTNLKDPASSWVNLSSPCFYNNFVFATEGSKLYKLDATNGTKLAEATLASSNAYGLGDITVCDDKVICGLADGKVQAFSVSDLTSLWIYTDSLGGSAYSKIAYDEANKNIFVGFNKGATADATLACINVTDENTSTTDEAKTAVWTKTRAGGFYNTKALVNGNYVVVAGEDGSTTSGTSYIYSYNKLSGAVKDSAEYIGDNRGGIIYDDNAKAIFFTSNIGKLYKIWFDKETGEFNTILTLDTIYKNTTCTPVIHENRVYVTSGILGSTSIGKIQVVNATNLKEIYSTSTNGFAQGEMLLKTVTNAQNKEEVFVFFTVNNASGGVNYLVDSEYAVKGRVQNAFTPNESDKQWCFSSLVVSSDGKIYYKNDSGNIFAIAF